MKQVLRFSIMLLALLLPALATAHDFEIDGIYYNRIYSNVVEVTYKGTDPHSSNGYSGSVAIPDTVAYDGTTYWVTSIGDHAFEGCLGLTGIVIPNSVTEIGDEAFIYCPELTSIVVESGNSRYDSRNNCNAIIESASNKLIVGCKNTIIPNSVTSIGDDAFYGCSGLTSIVIPNSVTAISGGMFYDCPELTSIVVESGNPRYDSRNNCNAIIETDNNKLIVGCKSTIIPNLVTKIGDEAFFDCTGLTSIVIPNSVTEIGRGAFHGCTGLTNINIPNSVTEISGSAFEYCTGLTGIVIPNSVTAIYNYAFYWCTGLTSINIPNSVTKIGNDAFHGCTGLTSIVVESGNPRYDSRNNCNAIVETASNKLIVGCSNTIIPNSVTAIGNYAFWCTGLTSIVIPNSVTAIGEGAFNGCTELTRINISNSVTEIGYQAFHGCTGLTSILIPNSVTAINNGAFGFCSSLTSIVIPNSVTEINDLAFYQCTGLTDVYCYIADLSRVSTGDKLFYWYDLFFLNDHGDYSGRTLHVLQGTADAYRADGDWFPYFGQIVEDIFIGDVNRDLEVNITDVNAVIDMILGGNTSSAAADVNDDGEINIADLNAIIDIILSGTHN